MKKRLIAVVFFLLMIQTTIAGCQNEAAGNIGLKNEGMVAEQQNGTGEETQGSKPDTSIVCYVGQYFWEGSLDPVKGKFSYGFDFINSALITVDPEGNYIGSLAESWEISEDGITYTFYLKEGIKFHDGSALTADDVVFTYEMVKENQSENENVDLTRLSSITAIGNYEVQMVLTEPFSPFFDGTAQLGIVPSNSYDADTYGDAPIGTGPWKFVQLNTDQQLIVEANENYYDGVPSIERVTFVNMDNEAAFSNARSGQLDVVMVQPAYTIETVEGMHIETLATMDVRNISLPYQEVHQEEKNGIEITVGNAVTADIAVRQALSIGIDRAVIIENAFNGVGKETFGFTENLEWGNAPEYEDGRIEEAIEILEQAGWILNTDDGVRYKGDLKCEFQVYTPASEMDRYYLAVAVSEEAKALGIAIDVVQGTWDELVDNAHTSGVVWGFGQFNPMVVSDLFYSGNFLKEDYSNTNGYRNPKVDRLIKAAILSGSHEEAVGLWKEVQSESAFDYAYLFLVNIEHCYFVNNRLDISVETQIPHGHGHGIPVICNMKDWKLNYIQ